MKPGPAKGTKKSAAHKKKISQSTSGKKNPRYIDGRRSYRTIAGAASGEVVHHKNGNRKSNHKSNLVILKGKKKGAKTTSVHEKITNRGQGRKSGSKPKNRVKTFKTFGTKHN